MCVCLLYCYKLYHKVKFIAKHPFDFEVTSKAPMNAYYIIILLYVCACGMYVI